MSEIRTPEQIIDDLFGPEIPQDGLLNEHEDLSGGHAVVFFRDLSVLDRDIVHKFGGMGINPINICVYARTLVENYAIDDPYRINQEVKKKLHADIDEARTFVKIFMESDGFFPRLDEAVWPVYDDVTGKQIGQRNIKGWRNLWDNPPLKEDNQQEAKTMLTFLRHADNFLDNPYGAPKIFNQLQIQEDYLRAQAEAEELASEGSEPIV